LVAAGVDLAVSLQDPAAGVDGPAGEDRADGSHEVRQTFQHGFTVILLLILEWLAAVLESLADKFSLRLHFNNILLTIATQQPSPHLYLQPALDMIGVEPKYDMESDFGNHLLEDRLDRKRKRGCKR